MKNPPRAMQPIVPQVSPDTWKALTVEADAFNHLAPWVWMHDSQVIGLRCPVTKEILLCSILGRLRTLFALLVYRRNLGHRWLLNTILNDGAPMGLETEDSAFEQDALKVEFVPKRELAKEDRAVLEAARYAPAAMRGRLWPVFRSLVPGAFPWHMTEAEAAALLFALPRVAAAARLTRDHPELWASHLDGDIAFLPDNFDPALGELRGNQLDWRPMFPPPEPPPEQVAFDEPTRAQLMQLPQGSGLHLEVDMTYSVGAIAEVERPRFPKLALAVDQSSGFVGGFCLSNSHDRDGAEALATVLRKAIEQLGFRPETIRVQRSRVAEMLSAAAKDLEVPVRLDPKLPALNAARQDLDQHFNRGR